MTRTWASCLPSPERGFTLLELLLVLVLAATAATLVLPSAFSALRAAEERKLLVEVESLLTRLPTEAAMRREPSQWQALALMARVPDWPSSWQLRLESPLAMDARGMSGGGRVQLWHGERLAQEWELRAGDGRPLRVKPSETDAP
ncbi:MAG: prepilin-type N-terminal cleavage/methylation domain-containing protein [Burkholderiales bacterium]|nr:prepilin-type N-terminal cleavage/methylation domain-containing protein [Burkholderiales bacterium]